eukprot:431362_1
MTKVQFNHDDDLVFTSAADNIVCVWDSTTGERLGTYEGHKGAVFDFDIDYVSKYLLTGSGDSSIKLWQIGSGVALHTFQTPVRVTSVNWSCGDKLFCASSPQFLKKKAVVHIYNNPMIDENKLDDNDLEPIKSIQLTNSTGGDFGVTKAVWSPLNDQIFALCSDCTIRIIDVTKGKQTKKVIFDKNVKARMARDNEVGTNMTDIRYSNDFCTAIVCSRNKFAKMYDINRWDQPICSYESDRALNTVAIHPKLDIIAIGGGKTAQQAALDKRNGKYEAQFYHKIFQEKIGTIETDCFSPLNSMDWNSDGSALVLGYEEGQARLFTMDADFDKQFNKRSKQFTENDDGSALVLGYEEGQARLFTMDADFDKQFNKRSKQFTENDDGSALVLGYEEGQ